MAIRALSDKELWFEIEDIAAAHEGYLHGDCVQLAIALHRLTGLPLYGLVGYEAEEGPEVLIHSFVVLDAANKIILDVKGPRSFDEMYEDFEDDPAILEAGAARLTLKEALELGLGLKHCPPLRAVVPVARKLWTVTQELRRRGLV